MPCDTAAFAYLTRIRLIVELAITPHVHPLISLLLTLPLCFYRSSSHVFPKIDLMRRMIYVPTHDELHGASPQAWLSLDASNLVYAVYFHSQHGFVANVLPTMPVLCANSCCQCTRRPRRIKRPNPACHCPNVPAITLMNASSPRNRGCNSNIRHQPICARAFDDSLRLYSSHCDLKLPLSSIHQQERDKGREACCFALTDRRCQSSSPAANETCLALICTKTHAANCLHLLVFGHYSYREWNRELPVLSIPRSCPMVGFLTHLAPTSKFNNKTSCRRS